MIAPSAADLIAVWDPASREPPHLRLSALLATCEGAEAIAADTLGMRNQRLLRLYRALIGGALEARVTCTHCAAENEFEVPAQAILSAPRPAPDAVVRIRCGSRRISVRIPRMADIEAASGPDLRRAVIERCRTGTGPAIPDKAIERLGREFEAHDPAANITVNIACSGCSQPIVASVDVASFVACEVDRAIDGLVRDIDVIASSYGWNEQAILALPPERRRRYVALIAAKRMPARTNLVRP